jgi:hypothetical protein
MDALKAALHPVRYGERSMKRIEHSILTALSISIVLLGGCGKSGSTATTESFTLTIVDLSNKPVASGHFSLPRDMAPVSQFTGSYEIVVTDLPERPSSQQEYAIHCLSQTDGAFSAKIRNSVIHINLHPLVIDGNVYLEGTLHEQLFKGKCFYQSYAGYEPFGTFQAIKKP